jgi:hypothetical protein
MSLVQETHEKHTASPLRNAKSGRLKCEHPNHIFLAERFPDSSANVLPKSCCSKTGHVFRNKCSGFNRHNGTHQFGKHVANISGTGTITRMAEGLQGGPPCSTSTSPRYPRQSTWHTSPSTPPKTRHLGRASRSTATACSMISKLATCSNPARSNPMSIPPHQRTDSMRADRFLPSSALVSLS